MKTQKLTSELDTLYIEELAKSEIPLSAYKSTKSSKSYSLAKQDIEENKEAQSIISDGNLGLTEKTTKLFDMGYHFFDNSFFIGCCCTKNQEYRKNCL